MKLVLILLLSINIYAQSTLYFLPKDSKKIKKQIERLIKNANKSIDMAIYNFGHKKFAKLLDNAYERGVKVTFFYEKKSIDFKHVKVQKVDKKLHTKIAIFDKKTVVYGSANWTKKSFQENYEVLHVTDDKKLLLEFNSFFNTLKSEN
ncbi:MAG: phospholipase D-like domain-containing protein [Campylobacterota bacterium]|nr:phospholipase D-like domain-containing protein [Campylobacterota bacterium]